MGVVTPLTFQAAKDSLKALGLRVKRGMISGQAGGHTLQPDETDNVYDGVNVSVSGSN